MTAYQRERAHDVINEIAPLLALHWREIAHYQDIPLDPDIDAYLALENVGMLRCFTARKDGTLTAGDHCRTAFCKARGTCPRLRQFAVDTVADDFVDLTTHTGEPVAAEDLERKLSGAIERVKNCDDDHLDALFPNLDMIDDWIRAVRARIEARLFEGATFRNVKLVQGKQGNRAWSDEGEVEKVLKSMRLKQEEMYDFKLISPTTAEKLLAKESPKRWTRLQEFIRRSEGKPSVAPMSDKRPALVISPPVDDFEVIEEGADLV